MALRLISAKRCSRHFIIPGRSVTTSDSDPSYLEGSPALAAVGDPAATSVTVDGLPSGKTVWLRYEMIHRTSLGKFVTASTTVVQVTYP